MLKLYNSLTRRLDSFKPLNPPTVTLYTCGPTVYDYMHIGNLRTFVFADILRRTLTLLGYKLKSVQNITDIDDKIIKRSEEKEISVEQLTSQFAKFFFQDILKLNILPADVNPKASEHVGKMIKYIEDLLEKSFAYQTEDGSIYFDISKFPDYGKLSRIDVTQLKTGTRILSDEYTKDSIQDFALWKSVKPEDYGYSSPWGRGRPGWHIECSVMSQEYLGETLDIHAGGIDLLFPHHENEIAQSQARSGKPFANFFVHGEHLLVDGEKMSKSKKNFYRLKDIEDKGFTPLALRYLFLAAHYRDKLNFTWDSLQAAKNALNNLYSTVRSLPKPTGKTGKYQKEFQKALENDLSTPQAISIMHQMLDDPKYQHKSDDLLAMDQVLGLDLDKYIAVPLEIPGDVKELIAKREQARQKKDFTLSDELRRLIQRKGFILEDTPEGVVIKAKQ